MTEKLIPLGNIVCTRGVWHDRQKDADFGLFVAASLSRHERRDWGDCCEEDAEMNDQAMEFDNRILSVYKYKNKTIWIITEADRSTTTILYPDEY